MDDQLKIEKSYDAMYAQMAIFGVVGIILIIFTSSLLRSLDSALPFTITGNTTRVLMFIGILIGLFIIWVNARREVYSANKDAIIVARGGLGSRNKKIYSIKYVTSVAVSQSFFGSKMGYGHIIINMDRLGNTESIRLTNIANPDGVLLDLQKLVDLNN